MCCSLICWTFGKVRKLNGQNLLALKEVNLHNPAFGKDKKARDISVEKIVSELTIIKEQVPFRGISNYCAIHCTVHCSKTQPF